MDRQQLTAILSGTALRTASLPFALHCFDSVASTNVTLWQLLNQGAKPGTVVIARQQTAGRGQWGRQWLSAIGGLYLSVAIAPKLPAAHSYLLTFCSAWGIATALRTCGIPVGIKWPNDLVLCERKLGGILTETKLSYGQITQAAIGVGINWDNPVPETGINLRAYTATHPNVAIASLEMLAAVTLHGIASGYQYCSLHGIDALLSAYEKLLIMVGRCVVVNGRSGVVVGVTSDGKLRVRLNDTEIHLQPGSISLGY